MSSTPECCSPRITGHTATGDNTGSNTINQSQVGGTAVNSWIGAVEATGFSVATSGNVVNSGDVRTQVNVHTQQRNDPRLQQNTQGGHTDGTNIGTQANCCVNTAIVDNAGNPFIGLLPGTTASTGVAATINTTAPQIANAGTSGSPLAAIVTGGSGNVTGDQSMTAIASVDALSQGGSLNANAFTSADVTALTFGGNGSGNASSTVLAAGATGGDASSSNIGFAPVSSTVISANTTTTLAGNLNCALAPSTALAVAFDDATAGATSGSCNSGNITANSTNGSVAAGPIASSADGGTATGGAGAPLTVNAPVTIGDGREDGGGSGNADTTIIADAPVTTGGDIGNSSNAVLNGGVVAPTILGHLATGANTGENGIDQSQTGGTAVNEFTLLTSVYGESGAFSGDVINSGDVRSQVRVHIQQRNDPRLQQR